MITRRKGRNVVLMLCDIRSEQNVGAIFRTADAVGVTKIILGGYTPSPVDRFGRERRGLAKASLGAEKSVPWEVMKKYRGIIHKMKSEGYKIVAVEQSKLSTDYKKLKIRQGNVLVLIGNEVKGLDKKVVAKADVVIEIPMMGQKESLNVSVAAGIALYRIVDV